MKRLLILAAALAALLLSGCGTTAEERRAASDHQAALINLRTVEAAARLEEAKAEAELAKKVDAGGAAAYLMAKALKGAAPTQAAPAPQQPHSIAGMAWQALLQVADIALKGWGIKVNRDVSLRTSDNNRDVALASYATFATMGGAIRDAGVAGYPYVQAPPPNITNTYTLSGTGVLGNGTYTGPVTTTTTTNCNGGAAAPGGNSGTTGAGSGGGAPGGNC